MVAPATSSLGTLTFAGIPGTVTPPDTFSGTISLSQAGESPVTLTITPGSPIGPSTTPGTVEYQITQQLAGTSYSLTAVDGGNAGDPVFQFYGAPGNTAPVTVNKGTFADTYRGGVTFTPGSPSDGTAGVTQNTYTLGALGFASDTYGSGTANTLDINGTSVSIAGLTAAGARQAIDNNSTLQAEGISASVSADATTLTIDGNTDGATLSVLGYNGGALALTDQPQYDYPAATSLNGSAAGANASYGMPAESTLTISGANSGDRFGGSFTLTQGSSSATVTISPGSSISSAANQIEMQLEETDSPFFVESHGGGANRVLTFMGSESGGPITIAPGTFTDSSNPMATLTPAVVTAGSGPTQGTFVLGALGSSGDTFGAGTGNANMLDVDGTSLSIAHLTAVQVEQAINDDSALQEDGVSATVNSAETQVTILGDTWGDPLTVQGYNGGALALTDQAPHLNPTSGISQSIAPAGNPAAGGTSVITMSSATDTLSGSLRVVVNGHIASLTVAPDTSGTALAQQIGQDASFQAAGLTAHYDSTNATVTITGPTGAGNALDTAGTLLTDTTASGRLAGAGADFTAASAALLSAASASNVLATVTSAIADVAYQRGTLGAEINQLSSASQLASIESLNLTSTQNTISATDYGMAASNLSKYQILSQTGISALAQANTVQQEVLKLLQ